jgi:hypothetical protein
MKGKVPRRMRSCLPCIKAKARCELDGSTCRRCAKKCITCHFDSAVISHITAPVEAIALNYDGILMSSEIPFLTPQEDIHRGLIEQGSSSLELPVENGRYNFDLLAPQFEFSINCPEFSSVDDVWGFRAGADSTPSLHEHMGDTSEPPKLFASIPSKRREGIAASVVATRMLRSYPDMMLQRTTFPPFIHHRFHGMGAERRLPRALANAMSIAQMFQQRSPENKNFIWQSIRTEQPRIMSEVSRMAVR